MRIKDTPIRVDHTSAAKLPKIAPFQDSKEKLDSYLLRFERFARVNRWEDERWAGALSALLSGKALDVYSRLLEEAGIDYRQLKEALLKRYDLTEDGYRLKFRKSRPEPAEKPDQFIHRLKNYLKKWMMFSKCDPKSAEEVTNMFLREQFLEVCPKDLAVHLKEREIASLQDLANAADRYLTAHQPKFCTMSNAPTSQPTTISDGTGMVSISERALREGKPSSHCYICDKPGHRAVDCRLRGKRWCFKCQKLGHKAKDFWNPVSTSRQESSQKAPYRARVTKDHRDGCVSKNRNSTSHLSSDAGIETSGCLLEMPARAKNGFLFLADGTEIKYVSYIENACSNRAFPMDGEMPVREGTVDDRVVQTLRDTGCSGILVKQELAKPDQYMGKFGFIKLVDCTVREVPLAKDKNRHSIPHRRRGGSVPARRNL